MTAKTPQKNPRRYDVYFRDGNILGLRLADHGITISDARIDWVADGRRDRGRLDSIEAVHLQTGGAWQNPLATCRITFCDGMTLLVIDGDSRGARNDEQSDIYGAFVDDLHHRLAAINSTASFTAGYTETGYRVVFACGLLLAAMFLGIPLVLLFIKPGAQLIVLLVIGAAFLWPLWTMLRKNAPRSYTPAHPPDDRIQI
jgi:tetrahydromethanopterin S-methyltransferase subunit F